MKKIGVGLLLVLCCLFLFAGPVLAEPLEHADDMPVSIPDTYLKTLINRTLSEQLGTERADDAAITEAEMALLTVLRVDFEEGEGKEDLLPFLPQEEWPEPTSIHFRGIRSIEGLQYAVNLEELDLSENRIADLTPLQNLTKLTRLELDRNIIADLEPLSGLTNLTTLNLYNNEITDITPIESLTELSWLDLHWANRGKQPLPIDSLAKLTNLEYISIESNDLTDISPLAELAPYQNLTYIKLNANHITDLTPLQGFFDAMMADEDYICTIEAINQSVILDEPIELIAPATGGDVTFSKALPEITPGSSMMLMGAALKGGLEYDVSPYMDEYETALLGFTFPKNEYGQRYQETCQLELSYVDFMTGTFYVVYIPIQVEQAVSYQLAIQPETPQALNEMMRQEDGSSYSDYFVGTLYDGEGNELPLETIALTFEGNIAYGIRQDGFTAEDLTISGHTFRFRLKADETVKGGTYNLQPQIDFTIEEDPERHTVPNDGTVCLTNIFLNETVGYDLPTSLAFDLSQIQTVDGVTQISTQPYHIDLPGLNVNWAVLKNTAGEEIGETSFATDNTLTFQLPLEELSNVATIYLYFHVSEEQLADMPIETEIQPSYVYGEKDEELEARFAISPTSLRVGQSKALEIMFDGQETTQPLLIVTSEDPSIAEIDEENVKGVKAGRATLLLSGLCFPYELQGLDFEEVCYQPEISHVLQVKRNTSSGSLVIGSDQEEEDKTKYEGDQPSKDDNTTTSSFQDVGTNHWAKEAIELVTARGIFQGTSDAYFSPDGAMTRGMFVTVLGRLAEAETTGTSSFVDVSADAYYSPYVAWAAQNHIVEGVSATEFCPEQAISRQEMAAMFNRYVTSMEIKLPSQGTVRFTDEEQIAAYAVEAVYALSEAGILNGRLEDRFEPRGTATRAEVAVMLERFISIIEK